MLKELCQPKILTSELILNFLGNLKMLDLSKNLIEDLPNEILELPRLRKVILFGNNLSSKSKEILSQLKNNHVSVLYNDSTSDIVTKELPSKSASKTAQYLFSYIGYIIPFSLLIYFLFGLTFGKLDNLSTYIIPVPICFSFNILYFYTSESIVKKGKIRTIKENLLYKNEFLVSFEISTLFDVINLFLITYICLFLIFKFSSNWGLIIGPLFLLILIFGFELNLLLKLVLKKKNQIKVFDTEKIPIKHFSDSLSFIYLLAFIIFILW